MFRKNARLSAFVVVLLAAAVIAPVAVYAAGGPFTDDDGSVFEADIEWMAANGVTSGCNPPANDNYCPDADVTRGQMAAFMRRLATGDIVDAADSVKLDGKAASSYESIIWATDVDFSLQSSLVSAGSTWAEMTVDTPADGYLLLNSSVSIYDPDDTAQTLWWIQLDNTTCSNISGTVGAIGFAYASVYANQQRQSASITGATPVTSGSHTVTLCGAGTTSKATGVYGPSLTAMFTASGVVPTP
ncbi:MAG TPA: S-layer homology domain-containing protein [Actinobacteria bacterium]|nr:S-layer homology domain-containing protein [Actinomycetota bacterium]